VDSEVLENHVEQQEVAEAAPVVVVVNPEVNLVQKVDRKSFSNPIDILVFSSLVERKTC
jgi:hypothetical protein